MKQSVEYLICYFTTTIRDCDRNFKIDFRSDFRYLESLGKMIYDMDLTVQEAIILIG